MSAAAPDRARVARIWFGWGFVFGAVSHIGWLLVNGSWNYVGPAPEWATWFWYGICLDDLVVFWLLINRPRAGIILGVVTMIVTLSVNWLCFPTFEHTFNYVLLGLTAFGVAMFAAAPWLWRNSPSSRA